MNHVYNVMPPKSSRHNRIFEVLEEPTSLMSATFSFLRKSVVVTGAAAGLGADLSRAFAKAGAGNLFLVDQQDNKRIQYVSGADENTNTLEGVAAKLRTEFPDTKVHTAFCDISDESQVKSMAENIRHVLGSSSSNGLDVLVNNAGEE